MSNGGQVPFAGIRDLTPIQRLVAISACSEGNSRRLPCPLG